MARKGMRLGLKRGKKPMAFKPSKPAAIMPMAKAPADTEKKGKGLMKLNLGVAVALLLLTGCSAKEAETLLTAPLHIKCVGKGETIIAAGPYAGTIRSDCGDGFEYLLERGK